MENNAHAEKKTVSEMVLQKRHTGWNDIVTVSFALQ